MSWKWTPKQLSDTIPYEMNPTEDWAWMKQTFIMFIFYYSVRNQLIKDKGNIGYIYSILWPKHFKQFNFAIRLIHY